MLWAVTLTVAFISLSEAIRPIIVIPGLFAGNEDVESVRKFVLKEYPDAEISTVTNFYDLKSFTKMWTQVRVTYKAIQPILDSSPDGVTLICYSQGIHVKSYILRA